ncbi:protein FAM177A1 isoform X2 [Sinocyclocheilus grahami]|uniref:protein FAM177A1 isoform X2 n=1 Tax=Sinocyclocheilus grahami TaxID=75366 RepID=UPI0007AC7DF8|nr:PREDICTED: protein FAM177A1-like isoform X2 [Sinocyclocheilus grahami]
MAEISLYLSSVSITVAHDMDPDKSSGKEKEYECVELGDLDRKEKTPRRIIHFSSGETMEEYSTDEEEEEKTQNAKKELLSSIDTMWRAASSTISACDLIGERMASLFGITSAKYQYAIDEYSRSKREKEERDEDTRLSEEAEHLFEEQQNDEDEDPKTKQPDNNSTQVQMTNELDLHPSFVPNTVHIPALVTST